MENTKNLNEIEKVYLEITNKENAINEKLFEIGQMYFYQLSNQQSVPDEYADSVNAIKDIQQEIEALRIQVKKLKGIIVCEQCGADVPDGSVFCIVCGARISEAVKVICPHCGAEMDDEEAVFCSECGKRIDEEPAEESAPETEDINKIMCTNCYELVEKDADFCPNCGAKLTAPHPEAVTAPEEEAPAPERRCLNCGSIIDDDAFFCTACGTKVGETAPPAPVPIIRYCNNCGKKLEEDERFCTACGTRAD